MKSFLVNILIIAVAAGLYYMGFFKFLASSMTLWVLVALIVLLLLLGVKIIGLPGKENRK